MLCKKKALNDCMFCKFINNSWKAPLLKQHERSQEVGSQQTHMSEMLWGRSETKEAWAPVATSSESPKYHQRVHMESLYIWLYICIAIKSCPAPETCEKNPKVCFQNLPGRLCKCMSWSYTIWIYIYILYINKNIYTQYILYNYK